MWSGNALADASDLARSPALAAHLRQRPVPPDVLTVLRLAWGCPQTTQEAVASTGCDAAFLKAASELYVQHVLCFHGADPYRTLGVRPFAPRDQMRLHMRQLMLCLHPDRPRNEWRTAAATRVLAAWRDVSRPPRTPTPELGPAEAMRPRGRARAYKPPWVPRPVAAPARASFLPGARRRGLLIALTLLALLCPNAVAPEGSWRPVHDAADATPEATILPAPSGDGRPSEPVR